MMKIIAMWVLKQAMKSVHEALDVNDDGRVDLGEVIGVMQWLMKRAGLYDGPINRNADKKTLSAIRLAREKAGVSMASKESWYGDR